MKLLGSGFVVTETTFAGTTAKGTSAAGDGGGGSFGQSVGSGFRIKKIVAACGATTVAANSSGGIMFHYGRSSGAGMSTLIVLPSPAGADLITLSGNSIVLDGLDIRADWFDAETNEAAAGGWMIHVFGD